MLDAHVKIKQLRHLKGYSQQYMADRLNQNIRSYSKLETGETEMTFNRFEQICEILEVTPLKALGFEGNYVFDRCKMEGHAGVNNHFASPNERELFEKLLAEKDRYIKYLESRLTNP